MYNSSEITKYFRSLRGERDNLGKADSENVLHDSKYCGLQMNDTRNRRYIAVLNPIIAGFKMRASKRAELFHVA